jgi:hypothetical protein
VKSAHLLLAAGKMRKNELVTGGFRCDLQNHMRLPACKHFQCKNRRFRVFEVGYWKDFQNLKGIVKEQGKTLNLIFSIN